MDLSRIRRTLPIVVFAASALVACVGDAPEAPRPDGAGRTRIDGDEELAGLGGGAAVVPDCDGDAIDDVVVCGYPFARMNPFADLLGFGAPGTLRGTVLTLSGRTGNVLGLRPAPGGSSHRIGWTAAAIRIGEVPPAVVIGGPWLPSPSALVFGTDGRGTVILGDARTGEPGASLEPADRGRGYGGVLAADTLSREPRLLVGDETRNGPGSVHVHSGAELESVLRIEGDQPEDDFGRAVCALADLDGDGWAEIAVGAPGRSALPGPGTGAVAIADGRSGRIARWIEGDAAWDLFGAAVSACPDLDGDGLDDLLVGAPGVGLPTPYAGAAFVHSSATGERLWSTHGSGSDELGRFVGTVPDLDGDGRREIVLGSTRSSAYGSFHGSSRVVSLPGVTPLIVLRGELCVGVDRGAASLPPLLVSCSSREDGLGGEGCGVVRVLEWDRARDSGSGWTVEPSTR